MIAVGGLSGSGKSTIARLLAPSIGCAPGALVLRSDEIRKQLCGAAPLDRLGPEGYTPEVNTRVYQILLERARRGILAGQGVIADAVFARPSDRLAVEAVASAASVPFTSIWLDAPEAVLLKRIKERHHDASDANVAVLRQQLARDVGVQSWRRVDASRPVDVIVAELEHEIGNARHHEPAAGMVRGSSQA